MACLRCKYCIHVYHELDESHHGILIILGELLDCKSESSDIDCLYPDDIDCMVHCILTQYSGCYAGLAHIICITIVSLLFFFFILFILFLFIFGIYFKFFPCSYMIM